MASPQKPAASASYGDSADAMDELTSAGEGTEDEPDGSPGSAPEPRFDTLGFLLPPAGDELGDSTRAYDRWFEAKGARRLRRLELWRRRLPEPGDWGTLPKPRLKALLRKGLPAEHRKEVWWSILGGERRRQQSKTSYAQYAEAARRRSFDLKANEEIERDLQRTFPNHRRFRLEAGQSELRSVLTAFAQHCPRVQYCQGLNFIAALFLIVMEDAERAFWSLVCAIETLGVERYYTEGMHLLRADMQAFSALLEKKCPKVARVFAATNADVTSMCSEWFITWFAKSMPTPTTLRVWDTLFFEGYKVLFRVAVGILKMVEPEILKCDCFEDIMEQSRDWPRLMVKHNELLKASFNGVPGLSRRDLLRTRDAALCTVEREDEERRRRRAEVKERMLRERLTDEVRVATGVAAATTHIGFA